MGVIKTNRLLQYCKSGYVVFFIWICGLYGWILYFVCVFVLFVFCSNCIGGHQLNWMGLIKTNLCGRRLLWCCHCWRKCLGRMNTVLLLYFLPVFCSVDLTWMDCNTVCTMFPLGWWFCIIASIYFVLLCILYHGACSHWAGGGWPQWNFHAPSRVTATQRGIPPHLSKYKHKILFV